MSHCSRHPEKKSTGTCRVCQKTYCPECTGSSIGICPGCVYKGLIILLIVMIVVSYSAWFGIF
ncbi:hypothetical protein [Methanofollis fontis]|uniref:B box-type domain-containing protein n=1 Tax=Methanofollis fontis TaxID=2052832 RepID=A0A483CKF4_9EURY|nr:hypothetical protein [Methanofollis fontis]TAJ43351.1 hypothetical protein CUJ86_11410 [Methanofollis fontis]